MEQRLHAVLSPWVPAALAVFRVVFALLLLCHASAKLFGFPSGPAVPVGTWPYWYAGIIELVCGLLIAVGLFTRPAAFVASGTMAFAYFTAHFPDSFWPLVNNGEPAVMNCFAFLLLVFTGPGAFAVDTARAARQSITT